MKLSTALACIIIQLACEQDAFAQICAQPSNCRADRAQGGKLIHAPNSNGHVIWTSQCMPNTAPKRTDAICEQIASCSNAGGFGKFLKVVTFDCKKKGFTNLFGLDGLTFGILDFTVPNLPAVLQQFGKRSPEKFAALKAELSIPTDGLCVSKDWACEANKQGKFLCQADTNKAFQRLVNDVDFQKAQLDVAESEYARRIDRFKSLGLKSEYGNVAMAVLANNLRPGNACKPSTWKAMCSSAKNEEQLLNCMFDQYTKNTCRGSLKGSLERIKEIKTSLQYRADDQRIDASSEEVAACVTTWRN